MQASGHSASVRAPLNLDVSSGLADACDKNAREDGMAVAVDDDLLFSSDSIYTLLDPAALFSQGTE